MYYKKPVYSFIDEHATGIDAVSMGGLILVESAGILYEKVDDTGLSGTSTVQGAADAGKLKRLTSSLEYIDSDLTLTVGNNDADYVNFNEALNDVKRFVVKPGVRLTLRQITGTSDRDSVYVSNADLSGVYIESADSSLNLTYDFDSNLTEGIEAFWTLDNVTGLQIVSDVEFYVVDGNDLTSVFIYLKNGSNLDLTYKNITMDGARIQSLFFIDTSSHLIMNDATCYAQNGKYAIRLQNLATASLMNTSVSLGYYGSIAVELKVGSKLNGYGVTIRSGSNSIVVSDGSQAILTRADVRADGNHEYSVDLSVERGGIAYAHNMMGGTNITPNLLQSQGMIISD